MMVIYMLILQGCLEMFGLGPPTSSFIQTNLLITFRKPCPGVFIVMSFLPGVFEFFLL